MKILEAHKLRLMPLTNQHEQDFIRLANIPEINQRINKPLHYTQADFARKLTSLQTNKASFVWMIEHESTIIGVINNAAGRDPRIFQGGYWIDPLYWGKGVASAALNLVKNFILNEVGAERIQAVVEPDNPASIKVLEKCGYQHEGLLRKFYPSQHHGLIDVHMYAVVR